MRFRILALLAACVLLAACGSASEAFERAGRLESRLEQEFGVRPNVSFKVHNGSLQYLSVTFEGDRLDLIAVGDLRRRAEAAVDEIFEERPGLLVVGVYRTGG